jgi:hypothetical protein
MEAVQPPNRADPFGVHAFKTLDWAMNYRSRNHHPECCSNRCPGDGTILGQVELWGIVWEHNTGYRAQFARPVKFLDAYGRDADWALGKLRALWQIQ